MAMEMADTVRAYLDSRGVAYEVVPHAPADTSSATAEAAHVRGRSFAKAVVVESSRHRAVVVVPAHEHVHLGQLRRDLGGTYALATEDGLREIFTDCDAGSVPPFGEPYGLDVLLDEALLEEPKVFVESGARAALLAIPGAEFQRLMQGARKGNYGHLEAHGHRR
jgi:Ala-tRNA(Pro) deacylase